MSVSPVVLVTGGAVRIGRAVALRLARADFAVAVHCRSSRDAAEATVAAIREDGGQAEVFVADLAEPSGPERLADAVLERFGTVDALVNNASVFEPCPLEPTTPGELIADLELNHAVHVRAPLELIRRLLPSMRARGGGRIVNLTDAGLASPRPGFAGYQASKAALEHLTRVLARELAPDVTVNAVAPGAILPPSGASPEYMQQMTAAIPAARLGDVEEVAATVEFLLTGPSYITGQILAVDGARG